MRPIYSDTSLNMLYGPISSNMGRSGPSGGLKSDGRGISRGSGERPGRGYGSAGETHNSGVGAGLGGFR